MKILILLAFVVSQPIYTHGFINNADKNLVDKATELGLTTFLDSATTANLVYTLTKEGPFTVFAPTDAAFKQLPKDVLDNLSKNVTALRDVLLYHLYDGNYVGSMFKNERIIPSKLKGSMIRFNEYEDPDVVTATGSPVIKTDQMATNGIIHVIDRVMYPIPLDDVVGVVFNCPVFSTLLKAVHITGLTQYLKGDNLTVLTPTNDAFAKIPKADLDDLLANKKKLAEVLAYHVVSAGTLFTAGLSNPDFIPTLEGKNLTVTITDDGIMINDAAKVIYADATVSNGVIHAIDTVLMPPEK